MLGAASGVGEGWCPLKPVSAGLPEPAWRACEGSGRWLRGGIRRAPHWDRVIGAGPALECASQARRWSGPSRPPIAARPSVPSEAEIHGRSPALLGKTPPPALSDPSRPRPAAGDRREPAPPAARPSMHACAGFVRHAAEAARRVDQACFRHSGSDQPGGGLRSTWRQAATRDGSTCRHTYSRMLAVTMFRDDPCCRFEAAGLRSARIIESFAIEQVTRSPRTNDKPLVITQTCAVGTHLLAPYCVETRANDGDAGRARK